MHQHWRQQMATNSNITRRHPAADRDPPIMSHGITPSRPVAPATSAPSAPTRSKAKSKAKTPFKTPFKTPLRSATKRPIPPPQEALPTPSGVDLAAPMAHDCDANGSSSGLGPLTADLVAETPSKRRRTSKSKPKPVGIHSPFRSPLVTRTTSTSLAPPSSFKSKSKSTSDRSSENELISSNHDATTNHSLHLQALHSLATPSRTPRRSPSGAPASASRHYHTPLCTQSDTLLRLLRAKSAVVRAQTADLVGRNQELQTFISHRDSQELAIVQNLATKWKSNTTLVAQTLIARLRERNAMDLLRDKLDCRESSSFIDERSAVESFAKRAQHDSVSVGVDAESQGGTQRSDVHSMGDYEVCFKVFGWPLDMLNYDKEEDEVQEMDA